MFSSKDGKMIILSSPSGAGKTTLAKVITGLLPQTNGNINYNGNSNSTIGYEMLEGLQPGTNFTCQLNLQRKMANNIQLTLNYNGRKSSEVKTIHTGGIQLRAFF